MRLLLLWLLLLTLARPTWASDVSQGVTLLADEDLLFPVTHIARDYATTHNTPVTIVRNPGGDVARAIAQGLEADAILTADAALLNQLAERGLSDVSSRRTIAQSPLALVGNRELSDSARLATRVSFEAILLASPSQPVIYVAADTPEGRMGAAAIEQPNLAPYLSTRAQALDTREEALDRLRDTNGLALMLAAPASRETDTQILALLPPEISPPLRYDFALLAGAGETAKQLQNTFTSPQTLRILAHYGFQSGTASSSPCRGDCKE